MIWSDNFINNLALQAEEVISDEIPLLVERMSLPVVIGYPFLVMPDYVTGIRRVTWKGYKVWPLDKEEYKQTTPQLRNSTSANGAFDGGGFSFGFYINYTTYIPQSKPKFYIFGQQERQTLMLYPAPNETLAAAGGNLKDATVISTCLIIEYTRTADSTHLIPDWIRRVIIRDYVLKEAFAAEGIGQNLKASNFYNKHYQMMLEVLRQVNSGVFVASQNYLDEGSNGFFQSNRIARPQLPAKYTDF